MKHLCLLLLVLSSGCAVDKAVRIAVRQKDETPDHFAPVVYESIHNAAAEAKLVAVTPFEPYSQYNLMFQNRSERELILAAKTVPGFVLIDIALHDSSSSRLKQYELVRRRLTKELGEKFTIMIHESNNEDELRRRTDNLYLQQ